MNLFALFFLFGVAGTLQLSEMPHWWVPYGISIMGCLCLLRVNGKQLPTPIGVALIAAALGTLLSIATIRQELDYRLDPALQGIDIQLTGTVSGIPTRRNGHFRFDLQVTDQAVSSIVDPLLHPFTPQKLRLRWYSKAVSILPGQQWRLTVRLKRPKNFSNPGGFDYVGWLFQQRVHATGHVRKSDANQLLEQSRDWQSTTRLALAEKLETSLPGASNTGLMQALLVGIRHSVPAQTWELLRATGTSHLLAISGLHIGMLAAWGYLLGSLLWRCSGRFLRGGKFSINRVDFATLASGIAALGYAWLAGFTLPTQRALIMVIVMLILRYNRRHGAPLTPLSIALVIVLLIDPLAPLSAGFWLSFCAVVFLLCLGQGRVRSDSGWRTAVRMHFALGVLLFPLTALLFGQGSIVAPLANFLAIPFISFFIVPGLMLWLVIESVSAPLGSLVLSLVDVGLSVFVTALDHLVNQVTADVMLVDSRWFTYVQVLLGGFLLFLPRIGTHQWLAVPMMLPFLWVQWHPSPASGLILDVLDTGHTPSVVIRTPNHSVLYGIGGMFSRRKSMASLTLEPFLQSQGVRKIDRLVIPDSGSTPAQGLEDLVGALPVSDIVGIGPGKRTYTLNSSECTAGSRWQQDDVEFEFLRPGGDDPAGLWRDSCWLMVRLGDTRILLTGSPDQASAGRAGDERAGDDQAGVVQAGEKFSDGRNSPFPTESLTILVAAQESEKNVLLTEFVDSVRPQMVVYSTVQLSQPGNPPESVEMRYKLLDVPEYRSPEYRIREYRTHRDGALRFFFNESGLVGDPDRNRLDTRRLWHNPGWNNPDRKSPL